MHLFRSSYSQYLYILDVHFPISFYIHSLLYIAVSMKMKFTFSELEIRVCVCVIYMSDNTKK